MIILDKPYVSPFLQETLMKNKIPTLKIENPSDLGINLPLNFLGNEHFKELYEKSEDQVLLTNSENALQWIISNLNNSELSTQINNFKDKYQFRKLMQAYYDDYFFQKVKYDDLFSLKIQQIPKPFVIKPNIGFFSLAVYYVRNNEDWAKVLANIKKDVMRNKDYFPKEVMDASEFIIEEALEGEEFAVDAYFNSKGDPIILNIYHHYHAEETDTGDRLYYTSKKIINTYHTKIKTVLQNIKNATNIKNFPVHAELRLDLTGKFGIIEVNPMRFAGFCVADLTWFAYGFNPYEYYFNGKEPDWDHILQGKEYDL